MDLKVSNYRNPLVCVWGGGRQEVQCYKSERIHALQQKYSSQTENTSAGNLVPGFLGHCKKKPCFVTADFVTGMGRTRLID